MVGSARRTSGRVRQSKLWISTRASLSADLTAARITSTNSWGGADAPVSSGSTLVSML
ncbi:hypothetical protein MAHJHV29_32600 [Mycobacterium avium subsp. hominissuis]